MKVIEKKLPKLHGLSPALSSYLEGANLAVLDIETTGLSPTYQNIILVGVIMIEEDHLLAKQFFAEDITEESSILAAFCDEVREIDVFFTYNGDGFDFPFIKSRCAKLNIDFKFRPCMSMDIYRFLRNSYFREILPDLKQKTVEKLFSDDRADTISGRESVLLYFRYQKHKRKEDLSKILLHNLDDIRLLYEILAVFNKLDVHKIAFNHGFFASCDGDAPLPAKIFIGDIKIDRCNLSFSLTCGKFLSFIDTYYMDCHIATNRQRDSIVVALPVKTKERLTYADLVELGLTDELSHLAGFHSGFLLICEGDSFDYMCINALIKELVYKITSKCGILDVVKG